MATLQAMLDRFGQRGTARIFILEGHPDATQQRISEAINPRKDRPSRVAAAKEARKRLEGYARKVDLRHYRNGPPDQNIVSSPTKYAPPIHQKVYHKQATQSQIEHGKVTVVSTGIAPVKHYDNTVEWRDGGPEIIPRKSVENLVAVAVERFGRRAIVRVVLFGMFVLDLEKYRIASDPQFQNYNQDYYSLEKPLGELQDMLRREQSETSRALLALPPEMKQTRRLVEEGDPKRPDQAPGFAARWVNRWHEVKTWIEINHIAIVHAPPRKK